MLSKMFFGSTGSQPGPDFRWLIRRPSVEETEKGVIIGGIYIKTHIKFLREQYRAAGFATRFFDTTALGDKLVIAKFFVPEMIFILQNFIEWSKTVRGISTINVSKVVNLLIEETWYHNTQIEIPTAVDLQVVRNLKRKPLPYQLEFIKDVYWQKKTQFRLNGYLLAFEPGLGKTTTSILLKEGLHKKHAIVIAPKSVTANVWPTEIQDTVDGKNIWVIGDDLKNITKDTDYVVINYEAIDKIRDRILQVFDLKSLMIIVDECHNFKDIESQRTKFLIDLAKTTECQDILLMSGTPIKALGVECIPILALLDTFWDETVHDRFKAIRFYPKLMNELLHNRLGFMMFRKLKGDVLTLPDKFEEDLAVKIKNGKQYTLEVVKKACVDYADKRLKYYNKRYEIYEQQFLAILEYYEKNILETGEGRTFAKYKRELEIVRRARITSSLELSKDMSERMKWINDYDREMIIPRLPNDMKKVFKDSRTVYKYVHLKVMGEVIGNLLNRLRQEMTSSLIGDEVMNVIKSAEKKTIIFSDYTDSLHDCYDECVKEGFKPMLITGANSGDAKALVSTFKQDPKLNPLIASIKCMSTGHTINEANTVIFLNVPYRSTDYEQASDRCYRIGQDTAVHVYKLVLDTGTEPNLSTRMHDILAWSKEQFGQIVDGETGEPMQLISKAVGDPATVLSELGQQLLNVVGKVLDKF